jgi:hypothetical protein
MNDQRDRVPPLDRPTVEFALKCAPDRCPNPQDTEREIWMKAGEHRLAQRLQNILNKQESDYVPIP